MQPLINLVEELKKSKVKSVVDKRMQEFEKIPKDFENLFRELCFCILTAGTSAELGIKTINHLENTLLDGSEEQIKQKLKEVYRFHTIRAGYIHKARDSFKKISLDDKDVRLKLVQNIKGLGMKEASHFLRNVGFKDYAIVDFHIVDILADYGLIEKPKTMTPKKYIEIENVLRKIAQKTNTSLGELDLYLWYNETGKVLK